MLKSRYVTIAAASGLVVAIAVAVFVANDDSRNAIAVEATVLPESTTVLPDGETSNYEYIEEPAEVFPAFGIPAITVPDGESGITEDSVRAYLSVTPFPYADPESAEPVITSVEFVRASEASERIEGSLVVPKNTLVCIVTLEGEFLVYTGSENPFAGTKGYWVFDAASGNLVNQSVLR